VQKKADAGQLTEAQQDKYQDLTCPLSLEMFKSPVKVIEKDAAGKEHVYYFEKDHIVQAIRQKPVNPLTLRPLTEALLQPAPEKEKEVANFKKEVMADIHKTINQNPASQSAPRNPRT
jgi:hypothetical protein